MFVSRPALAGSPHRRDNDPVLERPALASDLILSRLQQEYAVPGRDLNFHPSGDLNAAVYHVVGAEGRKYFLKLEKNFQEISVEVPRLLRSRGIAALIVPCETRSKRCWAPFGEYQMILYPFIEGKDGFQIELSEAHKRGLGAILRKIHSVEVPAELERLIPKEDFSPRYRELIRSLQVQAEASSFEDAIAAKLARFIQSRRRELSRLVERTEELAAELRSKSPSLVLCHSDLHGRNILIGADGRLYIVDWDNPILAPKERDLMFVGGGIDQIWKTAADESIFYEGYGKTGIDLAALAYYRYERILEDLAAYGEQLLLSDRRAADPERLYRYFVTNLEPGHRLAIAKKTDALLTNILTTDN